MVHVVANVEANKEYVLPVTWQVCNTIKVQAKSLEEAFEWAKEHLDDIPIEYDDVEYVDGSYEVSADSPEECELYNSQNKKRGFVDILVDDYVVVYDEYNHDYVEHIVKISSIECDKENITETNPEGKVCYGDDVTCFDTESYITIVQEGNFVRYAEKSEVPEQVRTVNIKWSMDDIDAESLGMPETVIIPDEYVSELDEDIISDWLSDEYGFCHEGFDLIKMTEADLIQEEQKLIRSINDAGVNAVEEFLGHSLDDDGIDVLAEIEDIIANMLTMNI